MSISLPRHPVAHATRTGDEFRAKKLPKELIVLARRLGRRTHDEAGEPVELIFTRAELMASDLRQSIAQLVFNRTLEPTSEDVPEQPPIEAPELMALVLEPAKGDPAEELRLALEYIENPSAHPAFSKAGAGRENRDGFTMRFLEGLEPSPAAIPVAIEALPNRDKANLASKFLAKCCKALDGERHPVEEKTVLILFEEPRVCDEVLASRLAAIAAPKCESVFLALQRIVSQCAGRDDSDSVQKTAEANRAIFRIFHGPSS